MNQSVVEEIKRRYEILVQNIDLTSSSMSQVLFFGNLCLLGDTFEPEQWMDSEYRKRIITDEEFDDGIYDSVIFELHDSFVKLLNQARPLN